MPRCLWVILLACVAVFSACSTDIDLYADYKEMPVIYGLLDANADTNYSKCLPLYIPVTILIYFP